MFSYKTALENLTKAFAINKHFDLRFYDPHKTKEEPLYKKNVIYN